MAELVQEDKIDLDVLYSAESLGRITRKIANLVGNTTVLMCVYEYSMYMHTYLTS